MKRITIQGHVFHVRLSHEMRSQIDRTAANMNLRASETARTAIAIGLKYLNAAPAKEETTAE